MGWVVVTGGLLVACGTDATELADDVTDAAEVGRPPRDAGRVDVGASDTGTPDTAVDAEADASLDTDASAPDTTDAGEGSGDVAGGADDAGADAADTSVAPDISRPPGCGNGVREAGEECDDGNDVDNDACSNTCVAARCGDGALNATLGRDVLSSPTVTSPRGTSGTSATTERRARRDPAI